MPETVRVLADMAPDRVAEAAVRTPVLVMGAPGAIESEPALKVPATLRVEPAVTVPFRTAGPVTDSELEVVEGTVKPLAAWKELAATTPLVEMVPPPVMVRPRADRALLTVRVLLVVTAPTKVVGPETDRLPEETDPALTRPEEVTEAAERAPPTWRGPLVTVTAAAEIALPTLMLPPTVRSEAMVVLPSTARVPVVDVPVVERVPAETRPEVLIGPPAVTATLPEVTAPAVVKEEPVKAPVTDMEVVAVMVPAVTEAAETAPEAVSEPALTAPPVVINPFETALSVEAERAPVTDRVDEAVTAPERVEAPETVRVEAVTEAPDTEVVEVMEPAVTGPAVDNEAAVTEPAVTAPEAVKLARLEAPLTVRVLVVVPPVTVRLPVTAAPAAFRTI